ncbi:41772_t:CDS:2 [Gigaspora margarita]|uniref:41772_t:CDS:1 n=1 Tax=Gigaspora margarita TaxID=4874 RepID=A0ABN7UGL5_GIGMA|nr:41772_t:CDS:2 [Gigaspora margarita]
MDIEENLEHLASQMSKMVLRDKSNNIPQELYKREQLNKRLEEVRKQKQKNLIQYYLLAKSERVEPNTGADKENNLESMLESLKERLGQLSKGLLNASKSSHGRYKKKEAITMGSGCKVVSSNKQKTEQFKKGKNKKEEYSQLKIGIHNINGIKLNEQKLIDLAKYEKEEGLNIIGIIEMNLMKKEDK